MGYVIATAPRSGSWLLVELLGRTGVAGRPSEYACRADLATWRDYHGCATHTEYFFRYPGLMRSPNGIFGTKLMYTQWLCLDSDVRMYFRRSDALNHLRRIAVPLRIIRLQRRDTVRQAVSLVLAQRTGEWSRRSGDHVSTVDHPPYDRAAVEAAYRSLRWQDAGWAQVLATADVPVLRLDYEDLAADPATTLARTLSFLELPPPPAAGPPQLVRQSGAVSEEWVDRARTDLADLLAGDEIR